MANRTFTYYKYLGEINSPNEEIIPPADSEPDLEEWVRIKSSEWDVKFMVNNNVYTLSVFDGFPGGPWKFTYSHVGEKNNESIDKFGHVKDYALIWKSILKLLSQFFKIERPSVVRFVGMTSSKRSDHFMKLVKVLQSQYKGFFKKQSYIDNYSNVNPKEMKFISFKNANKSEIEEDIANVSGAGVATDVPFRGQNVKPKIEKRKTIEIKTTR